MKVIQGSCLCGAVRWQFDGEPEGATICNCTACRRYGVLWAYDYEDEGITVSGETRAYARGTALEFHFCPTCGCVAFWRGQRTDDTGRRRIAVNLRLPSRATWRASRSTASTGWARSKTCRATADVSQTAGSDSGLIVGLWRQELQ